jgi:hypothetical protein
MTIDPKLLLAFRATYQRSGPTSLTTTGRSKLKKHWHG